MKLFKARFALSCYTLSSIAVLSLLTSGCRNSDNNNQQNVPEPPKQSSKKKWTVLVFMNGDNNLEPFALEDFEEMAKVGSNGDVNIVVQLDRHPKFSPEAGDWTTTRRFLISAGDTPTSKPIADIGEADMGSGQTLKEFIDWGQKSFPAEKYACVVWDHGDGYRLRMQNFIREAKLGSNDRSMGASAAYRGCSDDDTSKTKLYNKDVQQALMGIPPIDVLGFDCCLMSMVETAYAFRKVSKVFVGSEELEPGWGWEYTDWLAELVKNPSVDAEKFGSLLVNSYKRISESTLPNPTGTLAAIRSSDVDPVANKVSMFAEILTRRLSSQAAKIEAARLDCRSYGEAYGMHHVDLWHFCEKIKGKFASDNEVVQAANDVQSQLMKAVISNWAGKDRQLGFGSKGLAIYFPPSGSAFQNDLFQEGGYTKGNLHKPVDFVDDHKWSDFLHKYNVAVP